MKREKFGGDVVASKTIKNADCNGQIHVTCTSAANTAKAKSKSWKCELCAGPSKSDGGLFTYKIISQLLQSMNTEIIGYSALKSSYGRMSYEMSVTHQAK